MGRLFLGRELIQADPVGTSCGLCACTGVSKSIAAPVSRMPMNRVVVIPNALIARPVVREPMAQPRNWVDVNRDKALPSVSWGKLSVINACPATMLGPVIPCNPLMIQNCQGSVPEIDMNRLTA